MNQFSELRSYVKEYLGSIKGMITPKQYEGIKAKIASSKRVKSLSSIYGKIDKINDKFMQLNTKKELVLSQLEQNKDSFTKNEYVKLKQSIKRTKTANTLTKYEAKTIPQKEISVSGKAEILLSSGERRYRVPFNLKLIVPSNITASALKSRVGKEVDTYFSTYRDGIAGDVLDYLISFIPEFDNFKPELDLFINLPKPLKIKLMETVGKVAYDKNTNCFMNYIHNELQKHYIKHDIKKLEYNIKQLGYDETKGMTLNVFKTFMNKYYPNISYTILSPSFSCIGHYTTNDHHATIRLTFYVNNGHLYPINDINFQKEIENNRSNVQKYINTEVQEFIVPSKYEYMSDPNHEYKKEDQGKSIIIHEETTMEKVLQSLVSQTEHAIEYINVNVKNGSIITFKHPTLNIYFHQYDDFHARQEAYASLNKRYANLFGIFTNQTYAQIGMEIMRFHEKLPVSHYNKEAHHNLNVYEPKALQDCVINKKAFKEDSMHGLDEGVSKEPPRMNAIHSIDAYKQFSTIFFKYYQQDGFLIPVYDVHNRILPYDGSAIKLGEYYIQHKKINKIRCFGYFVHSFIVQQLLTDNIITNDDIKYMINTTHGYKPEIFKQFVEITATLGNDAFKKINNMFNGSLKNSKNRQGNSYFTNDVPTACFLINEAVKQNKQYSWSATEDNKYYFLKTFTESPNYSNTSSFYRACVSCSIYQILSLFPRVSKFGTIIKVQTDAVYYEPFNENKLLKLAPIDKDDIIGNLGKFTGKQEIREVKIQKTKTALEYVPYMITKKDTLVIGAGGVGKSHGVIQQCPLDQKVMFLSTTNNAVNELQQKCVAIHKEIPKSWKFMTFAMLECVNGESEFKSIEMMNKCSQVLVDEAFMTNNKYMRLLKILKVPVTYLGDPNQLHPIYNKEQPCNDPLNDMFYDCNIIRKQYDANYARYDQASFNIFSNFNTTGFGWQLNKLNQIDPEHIYPFYLVSTNKARQKYTKICCDHFCNDGTEMEFVYQNQKESYKVAVGTPVVCTRNDPELKLKGIANNWKGTIDHLATTGLLVTLKGIIYENDKWIEGTVIIEAHIFYIHFLPLYASTISKYQGGVIHGEYAILELDAHMCDKNNLYTSITRTTDYKNIYIDKAELKKKYFKTSYSSEVQLQNTKSEDHCIYAVGYHCDCEQRYHEFCDTNLNIETIDAPLRKKHGIKNHTHACEYDMYKKIGVLSMNKHMVETIFDHRMETMMEVIKQSRQALIKPCINTRYENKIYKYPDRLTLVYYDEELKKKEKCIKTQRCGIEAGKEKMNEFINMNSITVLSFDW